MSINFYFVHMTAPINNNRGLLAILPGILNKYRIFVPKGSFCGYAQQKQQ